MMSAPLAQIIPFVHPAIAAAALGMGVIPILVHLINRRRYRRVTWAAMSFLLAANRRSARRVRLEQWALLAARIAIIVLVGWAIARPYLPASAWIPLGTARSHRVLLFDNTRSMNARTERGATRFELAKQCAAKLIDSFPRGDAVSLVTLARPAEAVIAYAAYDRRFVRERLAAIGPTHRSGDTVGAIDKAIEILGVSDVASTNRTVHVLSDFPAREWIGADGPTTDQPTAMIAASRRLADVLGDTQTGLHLVRVGNDTPGNLAITALRLESSLVGVNLPVRISTSVGNFDEVSSRGWSLQLHQDGRIVRRQPLPAIAPGDTWPIDLTVGFSTPGVHMLEARLAGGESDALDDDDARYLSLEARDARPVLLVDGRPGDSPLSGQVGFLATALAPRVPSDQSDSAPADVVTRSPMTLIEPKVIVPPELDGEPLEDYDAVALCNVQRLAEERWERLEKFVRRGGGLVVFGGDLVSADNYNRFAFREGNGVLPGRIDAAGAGDDTAVGFASDALAHELVSEFRDRPNSGLFLARVERHLPIELDERRADVVLRYTDGEPAIVASTLDRGRVVLFTTTANMDWSNLPAKGDYVSLMLNTFAHVAPRARRPRNILVGDSIEERLTPGETSLPLHVSTTDGQSTTGRLVPVDDVLALTYGPIENAGVLTASIGPRTVRFAANVDPSESDLGMAAASALEDALQRPVRVTDDSAAATLATSGPRANELSALAMYLVLALVVVEMTMALRFGSVRSAMDTAPARERGK